MIERLFIVLLLTGVGWAAYRWFTARLLQRGLPAPVGFRVGQPAILYFSSPDCAPCEMVQLPAIHQMRTDIGVELQLLEFDVTRQPSMADEWGVVTLPTTFILDREGQAREINLGVASANTLKSQFERVLD